jgi:protein involved in polysaccharide export with SLBB domain
MSRAELEQLFQQYQAAAESEGYSSSQRAEARRAAARIRLRLDQGDFQVGDRIALKVENEIEIPDTLVVEPGPSIVLQNMGTISLAGVLRSEIEPYLTEQIKRFIRDPVVHASSMIRLSIEGAVGAPGFYTFPSDMLLSEVIMAAGGPANARLDDIELMRGEETFAEGDEIQSALQEGMSLDRLNLRAGDRIVVPADEPSRVWPIVLRWGLIAASSLILGVRLFF